MQQMHKPFLQFNGLIDEFMVDRQFCEKAESLRLHLRHHYC